MTSERGAKVIRLADLAKPGEVFTIPTANGERIEISIDLKERKIIGMEVFTNDPGVSSSLAILTAGMARSLALGLNVLAQVIEAHHGKVDPNW